MRRKLLLAACSFVFLQSAPALFAQIVLRSADDALQIALSNNRELRIRRQYAQEEVRLSKKSLTPFFPEFDFAISDSAFASARDGDYKRKSIEAGVTQKVFNGGKSLLEYKMQREKSFYDLLQVQKEEEAQKNKVLQGYYSALLAKMESDVFCAALDNAKEVLFIAELEEESGMISKTELLESKVRYGQIKAQAKSARDKFLDSCRLLNELLSLDANQSLVFGQDASELLFDDALKERNLNGRIMALSQKAVECSVDLKKARAQTEWEKKRRALQTRAFLPSVSVRAGFSFDGRSYPLTQPSYSFKVTLGFDNNPWLPASVSRAAGSQDGRLNSITDGFSAKGIVNTSWTSQMRLLKIGVEKSRLDAEKVQREIEGKVFRLVQGVESARENALLLLETAKLKEQKLGLMKIQLEQGSVTKTDYLENLSDCAAQKIKCAKGMVEAALLIKELEALSCCKI